MFGLDKFYEKYKLLIWPIFVVAVTIGVTAMVVVPQFLDYLRLREEITVINDKSASLEQRALKMEEINQIAVEDGLKVVFTILPADQDVSEALTSLEDLVNRSGLILKTVTYASAKKAAADKDSFQLNTSVLGPISSVRDFLINLKEGSRVFRVDSISARFQQDGMIVESDIPVSVFYSPSVSAANVVLEQPVPQLSQKEGQLLSKLSNAIPRSQATVSSEVSVPLGKTNPFE